jgi:acyl dehydratase
MKLDDNRGPDGGRRGKPADLMRENTDKAERARAYGEAMGAQQEQPGGQARAGNDGAPLIENRTFDEIEVGDSATLERTLSWEDIELFAVMSGDVNPAHVDAEYARSDIFHAIVAHGMWGASLISTLLGTRLPGPGAIYLEQTLRFRHPVIIGNTVTVSVTVADKDAAHHRVTLDCRCVNQRGETVIDGTARVLAPTEKVRRPRFALPEVTLHEHGAGA